MIEKVAKALYNTGCCSNKQVANELARAAIEAMRDPTEAMMDCEGTATTWALTDKVESLSGGNEITFCGEDLVRCGIWQAMIDAALKE